MSETFSSNWIQLMILRPRKILYKWIKTMDIDNEMRDMSVFRELSAIYFKPWLFFLYSVNINVRASILILKLPPPSFFLLPIYFSWVIFIVLSSSVVMIFSYPHNSNEEEFRTAILKKNH